VGFQRRNILGQRHILTYSIKYIDDLTNQNRYEQGYGRANPKDC
jgi:hypothetical protein